MSSFCLCSWSGASAGLHDKHAQLRYRAAEVVSLRRLLESLNRGDHPPGLHVPSARQLRGGAASRTVHKQAGGGASGGGAPPTPLVGLMDLGRVAVAGHSYGGATVMHVAAEAPAGAAETSGSNGGGGSGAGGGSGTAQPRFACAVALDPWCAGRSCSIPTSTSVVSGFVCPMTVHLLK